MKNKEKQQQEKNNLFNKWELNFLFTLIILLVMATILDLGVSLEEIINI